MRSQLVGTKRVINGDDKLPYKHFILASQGEPVHKFCKLQKCKLAIKNATNYTLIFLSSYSFLYHPPPLPVNALLPRRTPRLPKFSEKL